MSDVAGRRALVTGATGFMGSHVVRRLLADGAHVVALTSAPPDGEAPARLCDVVDAIEVVHGDIGDRASVDAAVAAARADVVVHLAALTHVGRSFAQADAHIYCTPEQVDEELARVVAMTREVSTTFGFAGIEVTLQTRPEKFLGRVELWDAAEAALRRALERSGFAVKVLPGEGAFYGPKIGFDFRDVLERSWTLATVQIDCAMPERFDLKYVTAEGTEATPVMIHRAVLGSIERFIAILLEHCAGALPLWLAPVQVRVLTVTDDQRQYADKVTTALSAAGWRAELDSRNEKLGYKIREAQLAKIPYAAVIGDKEVAGAPVAPRRRGGQNLAPMALDAFIERLRSEVAQERGEA